MCMYIVIEFTFLFSSSRVTYTICDSKIYPTTTSLFQYILKRNYILTLNVSWNHTTLYHCYIWFVSPCHYRIIERDIAALW
jgi:hypothetical protein